MNIVLTGASGGLGQALAAALAGPGVRFLLFGRSEARLAEATAQAEARGAAVETACLDITGTEALTAAIQRFDQDHPVDLLIANAGASAGRRDGDVLELPGNARRMVEINLLGAIATVEAVLPAMVARDAGQVVLITSISALRPHGDLPGYSASKAGLRAYGTALRTGLRGRGVAVLTVNPGFIATPMAARHQGPKPFEVSAEVAAAKIVAAIRARRAVLTFPLPLAILIWLGNRLPPRLSDWFERRFAASILPEQD
ncbi:MAG: SDR family NAD(P)-dependent oxidoreductase [Pseudomonadota bacterium]